MAPQGSRRPDSAAAMASPFTTMKTGEVVDLEKLDKAQPAPAESYIWAAEDE